MRRAEGACDEQGRNHRNDRADEKRRRHRQKVLLDRLEIAIERHRERDGRRTKQKVDELRAVEIGLVVRPGQLQERPDQRNSDRDGIDQRMPTRRGGETLGDHVGGERRRQPEKRRRLQINPEAERRHALALRPISRLTPTKTPTVTTSVKSVETTSEAASATPCACNSPIYWTTPTPAGTKNSDSVLRSPSAARPTSLFASCSSSNGRNARLTARPKTSSPSPTTGPGAGSASPRARTSPTSWNRSRMKKPRIMSVVVAAGRGAVNGPLWSWLHFERGPTGATANPSRSRRPCAGGRRRS